jgi:peptide/nickel transport system substrate-binding protein
VANPNAQIVIASSIDPRSLFAGGTTAQQEVNVAEQVTEKLIEFNADATAFEPRLATSWKQDSPTSVTLTLRDGVKFTNGEDFTAQSAVYSLDIMIKSTAYAYLTNMISGAEVVDAHTIKVTSKTPSAQILNALAYGSFMYPEKYLEQVGQTAFGQKPIGTGPFIFKDWARGDHIDLDANPDYWGGAPKFGHLQFKIITDSAAQIAAVQSGQVDLVAGVSVGAVDAIKNSPDTTLVTRPGNRVYGLMFNQKTTTALKDAAVRKALWSAVDVQALINDQLGGMGTPLDAQFAGKNYFGYDPSLTATPYDPDKAKQELAAAGYPKGFTIEFDYPNGRYPQDSELGQAIAAQLAKVGVTANQHPLEGGTFLTQLNGGQLQDMYFAGYLPPPDAHFLYRNWSSTATPSYFSSPAFDDLLTKESAAVDATQRADLLHQLAAAFAANPPFIPLFQAEDAYAAAKRLQGFVPHATQWIDARDLGVSK